MYRTNYDEMSYKKKCAAIGLFRLSSLVLASARLLLSFGSRKSHHTSLSILLFMWKFAWIKFMLSHRKDTRWNHSVSNFTISKREIQSFPSTYRESCRLRHPVLVSSTASFGRIGCDRGVASDLKTARMLCYRRQRRSVLGEAFEVAVGLQWIWTRCGVQCWQSVSCFSLLYRMPWKIGSRRLHGVNLECSFYF